MCLLRKQFSLEAGAEVKEDERLQIDLIDQFDRGWFC